MTRRYQIKQDDNLPVPESKRGRTYRFPFDRIGIGENFVVVGMLFNTLGPYKAYAERSTGKKFVTRMVRDDKQKAIGIGVWRVA